MYESVSPSLDHDWRSLALRGVLSVLFGPSRCCGPMSPRRRGLVVRCLAQLPMARCRSSPRRGTRPRDRGWLTVAGVVAIGLGIITFVWPSITALGLVALIGAWFIVAGVESGRSRVRAPPGTAGRGLLAVDAVVGACSAIYLIVFPGRGQSRWSRDRLFAIVRGVTLLVAPRFRRELNDAPAAAPTTTLRMSAAHSVLAGRTPRPDRRRTPLPRRRSLGCWNTRWPPAGSPGSGTAARESREVSGIEGGPADRGRRLSIEQTGVESLTVGTDENLLGPRF